MASIFKRGTQKLTRSQLRHEPYYVEYVDEAGKTRRRKGFTDKEATEKLAAELELQVAQRKSKLFDPIAEKLSDHRLRPIEEHLAEFQKSLSSGTNTPKHISKTMMRVRRIIDAASLANVAAITGPSVERAINALRDADGFGFRTHNHYLQAFDSFCRWLVRDHRLVANPISGLRRLNADLDIRHKRRSLTPQEVHSLIQSAANSDKKIGGYTGELRARAYLVSYATGLRRREMGSLTPRSFRFSSEGTTITIEAACSKHRREDTIPLREEVSQSLRPWIESLGPEEKLFPSFEIKQSWKMVRKDLERIGIPYENEEGIADFHAAGRASHITEMLRSGADLVQVMKQARHSDVKMTLRYFKGNLGDQRQAVRKLPLPWAVLRTEGQEIVSTVCGVEGRSPATNGKPCQSNRPAEPVVSPEGNMDSDNPSHSTSPRVTKRQKRRGGDSNPRSGFPDTAFPVLHNRPLCHLSSISFRPMSCVSRARPDRIRANLPS